MSYGNSKRISWGCLPALLFGVFLPFPFAGFTILGECVDKQTGRVTGCPSTGWWLLGIAVITGLLCWLMTTGVNRVVWHIQDHRKVPWWGWLVAIAVLGGFAGAAYAWLALGLA